MINALPFEEGTLLEVEGERYRVIGITDLGVADLSLPGVQRWGTHILTLQRHSDGQRFAATLYDTGNIGMPCPFRGRD
ncbi:MAG: hypothetical protein SH809_19535 [Rhodothermales bacterium]|nr:hypothetical protein [Rhodothermales bacterium]